MAAIARRPLAIPCADGYVLHGTSFEPAADAGRGATLIVCSAMLVREGYYASFALDMAGRGYRVITYDNRGVGRSLAAQAPGFRPRLRHWGELDLPAAAAWAESTTPDHKLCAIGHSMGGQVSDLSAAVHRFDALVTVAATAAWWGHWPFARSVGILAWYLAIPLVGRVMATIPAELAGLGPNVNTSLVRDWARWGRHKDYLRGPFGMRPQARRYQGRVLAFSFADDGLGARRAVAALHRDYPGARLDLRHVHPRDLGVRHIGHFGFFRGRAGPPLWDATAVWLDEALG